MQCQSLYETDLIQDFINEIKKSIRPGSNIKNALAECCLLWELEFDISFSDN